MANVKISDLAFATLPIDTANTFFELQTIEAGVEVSRKLSAADLGIGGAGSLATLTDVDLTGQAVGDLLFNVDGTNWEDTAGNLRIDVGLFELQSSYTYVALGGIAIRNANGDVFLDNSFLGGGQYQYSVNLGNDAIRIRNDGLALFGMSGGTQNTTLQSGAEVDIVRNGVDQVALTVAPASGGLQVNNLATGAGLERVLTTSDLTGVTFPIDAADNDQIRWGTGQDMLQFFDGTDMQFNAVDTVDFRFLGGTAGAEPMLSLISNAEVAAFHNGLSALVTATHGISLFGEGAGGVTNTRIEFLDSLPGGTRNFVIGALGVNQSNILDELLNRPTRIAGTSAGGIENYMIGTPNGDTLLQGNTGVRIQTGSGVVDIRTPSLRFSFNSAGQLNLLGNGTQSGVVNFTEGTSAFGSVAGEGQLWVRNDTPNVLVFTDDAGTDFVLNAGGGAPVGASYVVIALDATLTDERVLTAGNGITLTDGGAGGNATIAVDQAFNFVFSGDCEFTAVQGLTLGPSCELDMRNSADTSTTFFQNLGSAMDIGIAGADFGTQIFRIGQTSFSKVECPPVFIGEQAAAEASVAGDGQLWVRNDTPNNLFFTDDSGNDFLVAGTGAGGDISAGANVLADTTFVAVANVSPEINREYFVLAAVEITAPAADDGQVQFTIDTNARFYGTLTNTEDDTTQIIEGQLAEVVTNSVVVPTSGAATPGGTYCTIVGRLVMGATTGTMSLRCAKNADTGADGSAIRGAIKLIPIDP